MFLTIVGFIALVVVGLYFSAMYLLVAANGLGRYNIGGVSNGIIQKLLIVVVGFVVIYLWYLVLNNAPFSINFT